MKVSQHLVALMGKYITEENVYAFVLMGMVVGSAMTLYEGKYELAVSHFMCTTLMGLYIQARMELGEVRAMMRRSAERYERRIERLLDAKEKADGLAH